MKKKVTLLFIVLFLLTMFYSVVFAQPSTNMFYTVQKGDTIWKIAKKHNISMESLLRANPNLKNEKKLQSGAVLSIPKELEEIIPVDDSVNQTNTLIVHGVKKSNISNYKNVILISGRKVKVPTYKNKKKSKPKTYKVAYRNKFKKMSSRGSYLSNNIVKAAFNFKGVPYVFGGTSPRGFDCSGFVQYVYRLNGIKIPRMAHHQYYAGSPIRKSQLRPGDMVFFETYTRGISHVGIYIGNNKFIHASSSGRVRVNSLSQSYYVKRYRGAARYYKKYRK